MVTLLLVSVGAWLAGCSAPAPEPVPEPSLEAEEVPTPVTYADQTEPPRRPAVDPMQAGSVYVRVQRGAAAQVVELHEGGLREVGPADVVDLHRAPDGSVWALGSNVRRLDGAETIAPPQMPRSPRQLALDAHGRVWVASSEGVGRWDGSTWVTTAWSELDAADKGYAQDLLVDRDGVVWLSTMDRVYRFDGAWSEAPLPKQAIEPMPGLLRAGPDSTVLLSTSGGLYSRTEGAWKQLDEVGAQDTFDAQGAYRVHAWRKTAFVVGPDGETRISLPDGFTDLVGVTIDTAGRPWLLTDVGLHAVGGTDWWWPLGRDPLRGRLEQLVVSGAGPKDLPAPPDVSTVSVKVRFVRGGAPLANTAVELCPRPQMMFRGESPCDGSSFRTRARTNADGVATFASAPRADLRLTFEVAEGEWRGLMLGGFRCCGDAQSNALDLGDVELPGDAP